VLQQIFPGKYAEYQSEELARYVDFSSWYAWDDDNDQFLSDEWVFFHLVLRQSLIRENHQDDYGVKLPPADRPVIPVPLSMDDNEADPEFVKINNTLSDHCDRFNSMRLNPVTFQTALAKRMGTVVFPDGIPNMTAHITYAYLHSHAN